MEVTVDSVVSKTISGDVVTVTVEPDKAVARLGTSRQDIIVQDSYDIAPTRQRLTVNYDLPESITTGLFVDVADLRTLYTELNGEVGVIQQTTYTTTETDQLLTNITANYVANADLQAQVVALDFSQAKITPTGASFQEINDRIVTVENNTASHTQDIQIQANNYGSTVSRIETLEVSSGGSSAKIDNLAVVAAGDFPFWDGTTPDPDHVGNVIYTTTDTEPVWGTNTTINPIRTAGTATTEPVYNKLWQFLGTDLEPTNSGWRLIENLNGTFGLAKSIYTDSNGAIVGWAYKGGSGSPSEFVIRADIFKLASGTDSTKSGLIPFSVNATTGEIKFTGLVDFAAQAQWGPYTNSNVFMDSSGNLIGGGTSTQVALPSQIPSVTDIDDRVPISTDKDGKNKGHILRQRVPLSSGVNGNTKSFVSVGGATYNYQNWVLVDTTDTTTDCTFYNGTDGPNEAYKTGTHHYGWKPIGGTIIDGGNIVTGSLTAAQIDVNNLFAQNITATGTITGGTFKGGEYLLQNVHTRTSYLNFTSVAPDDLTYTSTKSIDTGVYSHYSSTTSNKRIHDTSTVLEVVGSRYQPELDTDGVTYRQYSLIGRITNGTIGNTVYIAIRIGTSLIRGSAYITLPVDGAVSSVVTICGIKFRIRSSLSNTFVIYMETISTGLSSYLGLYTNNETINIYFARGTSSSALFASMKCAFKIGNL